MGIAIKLSISVRFTILGNQSFSSTILLAMMMQIITLSCTQTLNCIFSEIQELVTDNSAVGSMEDVDQHNCEVGIRSCLHYAGLFQIIVCWLRLELY